MGGPIYNQCYWPSSSGAKNPWFSVRTLLPCGPYNSTNGVACCFADDLCLEDGLCRRPYDNITIPGAFYVSGCTNIYGHGTTCAPYSQCGMEQGSYVTYIGNNTWQCCYGTSSTQNYTCEKPAGVKFSGPPANAIQATIRLDANGTQYPLANNLSTTNLTVPSHSGLSGPDIAGIAVGATAVLLALLSAFVYCLQAYKKKFGPFKPRESDRKTVASEYTDNWVRNNGASTDASTEPKRSMEIVMIDSIE